MKFNTKKGGPTAGSERKSMKMEADELMEKIKGCVKEALEEQKAEGEGGDEGDPAVEAAPADIAAIIEQAIETAEAEWEQAQENAESGTEPETGETEEESTPPEETTDSESEVA